MQLDGAGIINSAGAFTGCLYGLEGGFAFESEGVQNADGSFVMDFVIVPGAGHGELVGLVAAIQWSQPVNIADQMTPPTRVNTGVVYPYVPSGGVRISTHLPEGTARCVELDECLRGFASL